MTGELVSFGLQKLWDLLSQKYTQFKGVEDQVTELQTKLKTLKLFMADADAQKHNNPMVRNCVEVIKEIVYDAEDILETFILRDKLRRSGGTMKRIGKFASIFVDRMKIASDMKDISNRISVEIENMKSFGVVHQKIVDGIEYSHPRQERQRRGKREEFHGEYESNFVGLEENVEKLVGYLVEEDNIQVVYVTGMGGLGKTTLARQAFIHDKVKSKFDRLAWVCVTQEFDKKSVWQIILKNFRTKEEEDMIMRMEENTLHDELFELLKTSKSLIVIDDIWEQEHWNLIRKIFPTKKGWKALLTSRNASVVGHGDTIIRFEPKCLTNQESWALFQGIVFPRKDASELQLDEKMEKIGKEMVEHCGGLPLAIRVLGGLLAEKYTPHDWERLSVNIGSHIMRGRNKDNKTSLNHVLSLSFEELPTDLKYCFLYLAHFPEDYEINVEELSYFWAAEEILEPRQYNGETIRDVGESYIEELVRRNMVISKRDVTTLRYETCQLHDMMREICLSKAKEENFLQILGIRSQIADSQSSTTSRRFVSHMPIILHAKRDINNPKVRSLMVVLDNKIKLWKLSCLSFTRLQLLRVLHIPYGTLDEWKLRSSIGKLIHLRYLNLAFVEVKNIPSSLGNLKLLIYLNINIISEGRIFVPNVLMGMKDLRYLALPPFMDKKTQLELSNLVNLETLMNFSMNNISLEDLHGMSRLRTLGIKLSGERKLESLAASIGGLTHLENLKIDYHKVKIMKEEDVTVLDFINLKQLELCIVGTLPDELHFPSCLTILSLNSCHLKEDPMPILEKLLHLKEVYFGFNSFLGRKMVCSAGGFPQLQKLELRGLKEWEEWIVEEDSMKLLHTLNINSCEKLKELPDGLRFITSLKHLELNVMGEKWEEKLSKEGEDYYKVQHIPSVKIQVEW